MPRRGTAFSPSSARRSSSKRRPEPARPPHWSAGSSRWSATGWARSTAIVAVTFTEKAAGEMKLRLRTEIERAAKTALREQQTLLDRALRELELARIGTIHAFCGDLLRERPVEAGVDPLFEVAAEDEAATLADRGFRELVPGGARRPAGGRTPHPQAPVERPATARDAAQRAMLSLIEHRDFPTPWRRDPFDRDGVIDALMDAAGGAWGLGSQELVARRLS